MATGRLNIQTIDGKLNLTSAIGANIWDMVEIKDSIFSFYPKLTLMFNDRHGLFKEGYPLSLGMDVILQYMVQYGDKPETPEWKGTYFISDTLLDDIETGSSIAGRLSMFLYPTALKRDSWQSRSYPKDVVAAIQTMKTELTLKGTLGLVTPPTNTRLSWLRVGTVAETLQNWAKYCLSADAPLSPWLTFIDRDDNLFFAPLQTLIMRPAIFDLYQSPEDNNPQNQKPVYSNERVLSVIDEDSLGYSVLVDDMNARIIKRDITTGVTAFVPDMLSNHLIRTADEGKVGNMQIQTKDYPLPTNFTDMIYYGDVDPRDGGVEDHLGWVNGRLQESCLPYRKKLLTPYNKNLKAGVNINLFVDKNFGDGFSPEDSGKWIIISSVLYESVQTGKVAYIELEIGKSTLNIRNENTMKGQYK